MLNVGLLLVVGRYLIGMLKTGQAIGLFFDFSRDLEPIRYWIWAAVTTLIVLGQSLQLASVVSDFGGS